MTLRVALDGIRLGKASRRLVWDAETDKPAIVFSTWRVRCGTLISMTREGAGSQTTTDRDYEPGEPIPINPVPR